MMSNHTMKYCAAVKMKVLMSKDFSNIVLEKVKSHRFSMLPLWPKKHETGIIAYIGKLVNKISLQHRTQKNSNRTIEKGLESGVEDTFHSHFLASRLLYMCMFSFWNIFNAIYIINP